MKTNLKKALVTKLASLGMGLLLLEGASTWAADMCFLDAYDATMVASKFKFPNAGACTSFNGYELGTNCLISGTAGGTADNGSIRFHLDTSCPNVDYQGISSFSISRVNANLPQAGYGYSRQIDNATLYNWHIKTIPCPNPHPLQ